MFVHPASQVCSFRKYSLDEILPARIRSFLMCLFRHVGRQLLNRLTQATGCNKKANFSHLSEKAIADEHLRQTLAPGKQGQRFPGSRHSFDIDFFIRNIRLLEQSLDGTAVYTSRHRVYTYRSQMVTLSVYHPATALTFVRYRKSFASLSSFHIHPEPRIGPHCPSPM